MIKGKSEPKRFQSLLNDFFSNFLLMVEMRYPELFKSLDELRFRVGLYKDKVIVLINLGGAELTLDLV